MIKLFVSLKVLAVAIMRFGTLHLRAMFLFLMVALYLILCTLHTLLNYLTHQFAETMRHRVKFVFIPIHLAFIILFVIGMLGTGIGATCSANAVYPSVFYFAGVLMIILFAVIVNLFLLNYLLHGDEGQNNEAPISGDRKEKLFR